MRRSILSKAADLLLERQREIAGIVTEETGGVLRLGMSRMLSSPPGCCAKQAAQAYGLVGEVIPSDVPGKLAMGVRAPGRRGGRDRAVECSGDPGHASGCNAARVRGTRSSSGPPRRSAPARTRTSSERSSTRDLPPGVVNLITNAPERRRSTYSMS